MVAGSPVSVVNGSCDAQGMADLWSAQGAFSLAQLSAV